MANAVCFKQVIQKRKFIFTLPEYIRHNRNFQKTGQVMSSGVQIKKVPLSFLRISYIQLLLLASGTDSSFQQVPPQQKDLFTRHQSYIIIRHDNRKDSFLCEVFTNPAFSFRMIFFDNFIFPSDNIDLSTNLHDSSASGNVFKAV